MTWTIAIRDEEPEALLAQVCSSTDDGSLPRASSGDQDSYRPPMKKREWNAPPRRLLPAIWVQLQYWVVYQKFINLSCVSQLVVQLYS